MTLTGAAIAGAAAIASGGVLAPFGVATAGITALSATTDRFGDLFVDQRGESYDELMTAFEAGLADIDDAITKQETVVMDALQAGWTVFDRNRSSFDLTPRLTDDDDGRWNDETSLFDAGDASAYEMILPPQSVVDSLSTGLVNLGHGIDDAGPKIAAGADDRNLLSASAREVGLRYGVSDWMWILGDTNGSSVRDLTWDVREGNTMLLAFVRDFRDADAASQSALDRLRQGLRAGSGEDPW